ncbi:MAG TPA: 4-(cytidine 5'-diphospho)-2-C-methyl-D-erythritol kinase [Nitrospiria bacterium]|nr:4-(cytidine 5'-diphospho)-2-C-methyl-D-erythritol kinase [Nitrospiria bacterium]
MALVLHPPAKINLYLRVGNKRPDGYHGIDSLFQMIDLSDTLWFEPLKSGFELVLSGRSLGPAVGENLVIRAARLLQESSGEVRGVRMRLQKKIPAGAGLGGGSSDAAATLIGLNRLWELGWSRERLMQLGAQLGSDVSFFLGSPTAWVGGKGDLLREVFIDPDFWIVLVFPGVEVNTTWGYAALDRQRLGLTNSIAHTNMENLSIGQEDRVNSLGRLLTLGNDFEDVVLSIHPKIARAKEALVRSGAELARMSGSGSAVFGLFFEREKGEKAAEILRGEWGEENVWLCRPLRRSPLEHF